MIRFTHGDILRPACRGHRQSRQLRRRRRRRPRPPVQAPPPRRLPSLPPRLRRAPAAARAESSCSTPAAHTPRWIVHFPTKRHWRDRSTLGDIEAGLRGLAADPRRPRHRLHRHPAARVRPGRSRLARGAPPHDRCLADLPALGHRSRTGDDRRSRAQVRASAYGEERETMTTATPRASSTMAPRWCPTSSPRPRKSASCCASPRRPG